MEKRLYSKPADDRRVVAVERVIRRALGRAGIRAAVLREARDHPWFWTVGMNYDQKAAGVTEREWDAAIEGIDAALRNAGLVASDSLFNGWVAGKDDLRERKIVIWRVDVRACDGPPKPDHGDTAGW